MSASVSGAGGSTLAVIPARGGSKGLPGKNVRLLGGHPLIAWSIAAAKASPAVDRIICSTDSPEIAKVAASYGAEIPFLRPAALAADMSTDLDVFEHLLGWLDQRGELPERMVQLRPTTPFRDPDWIDQSVRRMQADPAISCVRSIAPAPLTPYKMWLLQPDGLIAPLLTLEGIDEPFNMPRQKLPPVHWHTGQLDVIDARTILGGSMTGPVIAGLEVDVRTAVDIDALEDFLLAELIFEERMPPALREAVARRPEAKSASPA